MTFHIVPAHEVTLAEQAKMFNRAFAGYLAGWHDMDASGLARFICAQGIDLCYSRFVRFNGEIASFGFINRTGETSRLAGMGTVPEARRTGAAAFLLSHLLDEAKQRGDHAMVLEVFEQNIPALPLYRRHGFRELMRLLGWRRPAGNGETPAGKALEEISSVAAHRMDSALNYPDIPWQVSQHIVPKLANVCVYKIDNACVVIGNPDVAPVRIHAMFGPDVAVRDLLTTILAKFSQTEFFAPPIFPESLGASIFQQLGFVREPLNQLLMRCDLQ